MRSGMNFTNLHSHEKCLNRNPQTQHTLDWSVVVIARNEEVVIRECLKSVVNAFNKHTYELIVVDSASTDKTVTIAQSFPARIVQLTNTVPLRPSVGRHIGFQATRGKWILFLDGDSILESSWVDAAAVVLRAEPKLGGIAGELEHIPPPGENKVKRYYNVYPEKDYQAAEYLAGSTAYKREALERAGGFNPFMHSAEEAELGARLRKNGYVLRRLRIPMTKHYFRYPKETVRELLRRVRRGYYFGMGQLVRYTHQYDLPISQPYKAINRHVEFFTLLVLGMATAVASIVTGQTVIFLIWLALLALIFTAFVLHARSLYKPAYYFLAWTLTSPIVIWGFLKFPHPAEKFPDFLTKDTASFT